MFDKLKKRIITALGGHVDPPYTALLIVTERYNVRKFTVNSRYPDNARDLPGEINAAKSLAELLLREGAIQVTKSIDEGVRCLSVSVLVCMKEQQPAGRNGVKQ